MFDYDADGSHDLIGECRSSLGQLKALAGSAAQGLDLVNPKKTGRPGYQRSGVLSVREVSVRPRPSFLQYLAGGRATRATFDLGSSQHTGPALL